MKKHLLSLVLCCFAIFGFAQEHLSFKGIPIEGSMTAFCQKLTAKGFTQIGRDNNVTMFTGCRPYSGKSVSSMSLSVFKFCIISVIYEVAVNKVAVCLISDT